MTLDQQTLSLATGIVVLTAGLLFVVETVFRRDSTTSRLWSLGYLAGILTAFSYLLWSSSPSMWWAVAVGNAAFVVSAGAIWNGNRSYNGRRSYVEVTLLLAVITGFAAGIAGPDGGDWAGAPVWFASVAVLAGFGAAETWRGALRKDVNARGLSVVLTVESLLFAARFVTYFVFGTSSYVFTDVLGTATASILTMVLMVVAAVSMSVLRSETSFAHARRRSTPVFTARRLVDDQSFQQVAADRLERAHNHDERVALLHVDLDDLETINTAFGRSVADLVITAYATTVRNGTPTSSVIGEVGAGRISIVFTEAQPGAGLSTATALRRALLDTDIPEAPGASLTASIGVATTEHFGYDLEPLHQAARRAADDASAAGGNRVSDAWLLEVSKRPDWR